MHRDASTTEHNGLDTSGHVRQPFPVFFRHQQTSAFVTITKQNSHDASNSLKDDLWRSMADSVAIDSRLQLIQKQLMFSSPHQ